MKVLITDKCNDLARQIISEAAEAIVLPTMNEDELIEKIGEFDGLIIRSDTKVTAKVIEAATNLKIIGRAGVGVDNIDVKAATEKGIIVVNSPDGNTHSAAEHTLALMLSMARKIPQANVSMHQGKWERANFKGIEVFGKTLGIIGLGKIGSHVAKVASAMNMKVLAYDPFTSEEKVNELGAEYIHNLDDLWGQCDFITVHVPKTAETTDLINKNTIAKMKKNVRIINCARGGIINEQDLREALDNGLIAGAAIDVFENEPNIQESPLFGSDKDLILTPHLGATTVEAQINVAIDVAEQIRNVLTGGSASTAVNIPSLKPEKLEPVKDYMLLAQNLGEFSMQNAKGNLKSIEINIRGTIAALDVSPLETAVLKGIFSSFMQAVNFVNAPVLAKQKGITVTTSKTESSSDYAGSITVKVLTDKEESLISGAMIAKDIKRIVKINEYNTSIELDTHMLLVPHKNIPCMIAKVAAAIGENDGNINHMIVSAGQNLSIMIITTDRAIDKNTLTKITQIDGVESAKYINLSK